MAFHRPMTVPSATSESARIASDGRMTTPADVALGDEARAVVVDELYKVRYAKLPKTRIRQAMTTLWAKLLCRTPV